jgi:ech hydrogenase subunit D
MIPEQVITPILADCLVGEAKQRQADGWRLVQICSTSMADAFELSYSFTIPGRLEHMRLIVPRSAPNVPSITPVFSGAFTYENEMHDLFGIEFDGLKLFYNGAFIKTTMPTPFKDVAVLTAAQPAKK